MCGCLSQIWSTVNGVLDSNRNQLLRVVTSLGKLIGIEIPEIKLTKLKSTLEQLDSTSAKPVLEDEYSEFSEMSDITDTEEL